MIASGCNPGGTEAVHTLRPFVARYEGENLMSGRFVTVFGNADRYLDRIAALNGERASAEQYFTSALWTVSGCRGRHRVQFLRSGHRELGRHSDLLHHEVGDTLPACALFVCSV